MASKPNPLEPGGQKFVADFVVRSVLNRVEHSSLFGLSMAGVLLVLVGLLDYLTGYEIGFALLILLLECDRAAATEVVSRCMTACSERIQRHNWPIGLSVGVAVFNGGGRTIDELLACADQVMYQSKRSGKYRISCVTFEELDASKTPNDIVEIGKERRSKTLGV